MLFPIVAVVDVVVGNFVVFVDFIGVDFVVAALLVSSPEHMKKEQETVREMNWKTKERCLARIIHFFHLFMLVLMLWILHPHLDK